MTITELINCDVAKLEAMSDTELENYFRPMFEVTRPVKVTAVDSRKPVSNIAGGKVNKYAKLSPEKLALLKQMGIVK